VIRVARVDLEEKLRKRLDLRTTLLVKRAANAKSARRSWKGALAERNNIKSALSLMATGIERCMYCGDNRGTDIDHFEPISISPRRTFEWQNHLLACSSCNSNAKRDSFPCDSDGKSLLINPAIDEPSDHIELSFSQGKYEGVTLKGQVTIDVFQLNRGDLEMGRAIAFARCKSMLRDYLALRADGLAEEACETKGALENQPFADVLHAMYRAAHLPGATMVLGGPDVVKLLIDWQLSG
jgi:uncharacterized protein (TIGR02646 family)